MIYNNSILLGSNYVLGVNDNKNLSRSRSVSNTKSALYVSQDSIKKQKIDDDVQKIGKNTALLLKIRQKSITRIIAGINHEFNDKYKNNMHLESMYSNGRNRFVHSKCLFRSGDGFRIKWDLIIMFFAIYNCFMVPVQF